MKINLLLLCLAGMNIAAFAGGKMSDAEIKQKLLGYWSNPHHGYHIAADGIMYVCPQKSSTTKYHWSVKDGKFYLSDQGHTIVTLTDKKFVYREPASSTGTA